MSVEFNHWLFVPYVWLPNDSGWIEEHIFTPLRSPGSVTERLTALTEGIDRFYQSGQDPCVLAVMSLGEADTLFHQQLEASLKTWLTELA